MRTRKMALGWVVGVAGMIPAGLAFAQSPPATPATGAPSAAATSAAAGPAAPIPMETRDELLGKLNAEQKKQFDDATKAFGEQKFGDAMNGFKGLLGVVPDDVLLSKFASEAALNNGDAAFAVKTLKPIVAEKPDDWQAAAVLTRACAESGDAACRDAGIAHMLELRQKGLTPVGLRDYVVERVKVGDKTLIMRSSLTPWGGYHVYALGQVAEANGQVSFRVALESGDFDQPAFAKEHPDQAAKGMRRFSLDGYRDTAVNDKGQKTQTHFTYKFFDGQPTYAQFREEVLKVVQGETKPISSTNGVVVP